MSLRPRKIPELPVTTSLDDDDLIIVEKVSGSSSKTSKISYNNFMGTVIKGPYTNDDDAADGGVLVGGIYYTLSGDLKVRLI